MATEEKAKVDPQLEHQLEVVSEHSRDPSEQHPGEIPSAQPTEHGETSGARISTPRGAPGKRSAVRQRSAISETPTRSASRPVRRALLEEGLHALLDVLGRERDREL